MQTRLRSKLVDRQNDINDYQKQKRKKVDKQLQQYAQGINYGQTKFFNNCQQLLKDIAKDAKNEQKIIIHKKKMKQLKQNNQNNLSFSKIDEMLMLNVMVDYFRSYNMNYCYSMIMRQKNIISEQIVMKGQLAQLLGLNKQLSQQNRFNVSILELIIQKINRLQQLERQKKQQFRQVSIQCQLISNRNEINNILLTQIKLQQIRKQIQIRQKKYYQSQIYLFKSQQLIKLKQDMNKLYQLKQNKINQNYQHQIKSIIKQQTQSLNYNANNIKLQEYLEQIGKLQKQIRTYKQKNAKLQKDKLQHDCLQNQNIKQKLLLLGQQRKQLQIKKYQYQLAIKNISTNVQDMAMKKNKLLNNNKKQTQQFMNKIKIHKQNKDYMIQKIYSTLKGFQQRIQNLSQDNSKLYQENNLLRTQLNAIKKLQQTSLQQQSKKRINLSQLKIPTKNISIGVTPDQISGQTQLEQSQVSSVQSALTYTTDEFEDKMKQKTQQSERINKLKLQMNLLKNKVKYLVMDFQ